MRVALIANPRSGRRRGLKAAEIALRILRQGGWAPELRLSEAPGDAARQAHLAAEAGCEAVFVCGGDGSLSEAANGLAGTNIPLGVIPAGTGNDFARTAGISIDPRRAARQVLAGTPRPIDLLDVNHGALWSINVMGIGLDARVAARTNRRVRWVSGMPAYLMALAAELVDYRLTPVRIRVDGQEWEGEVLLLAVANAISYGAGIPISPRSRIDDGRLEVVAVGHVPRITVVPNLLRVMGGKHLSHPSVKHWSGIEVSVETPEPTPLLSDGDLKGETPFSARVAHGVLRFWLPEGFQASCTQAPDRQSSEEEL
ncbi:MAG: diacylglycerol kinase family lipid kinase [Armatimonadetes bacterium]|nr:diacylglycerol kinase family lipid kinase [Armatimonadota bacterium]